MFQSINVDLLTAFKQIYDYYIYLYLHLWTYPNRGACLFQNPLYWRKGWATDRELIHWFIPQRVARPSLPVANSVPCDKTILLLLRLLLLVVNGFASPPTCFFGSRTSGLEFSTWSVAAFRRDVSLRNCETLSLYRNDICTNLLLAIHRSETAVMARLPTLSSDILDLFVRSVVEITGVGIVDHCDMW